SAPQFTEQLLSFGVAYGLALQGADQGSIGSSLLPSEIARQAVWRKKRPFFAAAAACLLLAAGVIWARQITDLGALQANKGRTVPRLDLARAADVIDNDLPGTTPDYEYAQKILAAGNTLKSEYQGLVAQGANEKQTVEQILGLGRNRVVMLRLLDLIHQALPEPAAPLAEATTPAEYLAAARQGPNRRSRNQVFIESVRIDYDPDVNEINLPDVSGLPVDELELDAGLSTEGFIVTLKCRTPNRAGVKFVSDVFMPRLRELGRRPATGLCVNRVVLTRLNRLVEDEGDSDRDADRRGQDGSRRDEAGRTSRDGRSTRDGRSRSGGSSAFGGRGRGGGRRGGRGARGPTRPTGNLVEAIYYDPVTNESMDGDWLFVVEFDVRLHDAPEPDPEMDAEEQAEPEPPDRD
ncbi:MAG: hypothetical protein IID40_11500, partial [Planctomycetes bacterium]|nr:hypothetical protein [Planctomycetota bacterium]